MSNLSNKDIQKEYYKKNASKYEYEPHHEVMFDKKGPTQKRIREALYNFSKQDDESLLDVACGTGNILFTACDYYRNVVGLDLSPEMLKIASSKTNAELVLGDADELPFKDNTFSVVTCYSALHHMERWDVFFNEVHRVLKPGGVFWTDWDPHGPEARSLWLVNMVLKIQRFGNKGACSDELNDLAERHKSYTGGFSAFDLATKLEDASFPFVRLFFHNNFGSLLKSKTNFTDILYFLARHALFLRVPRFKHHELMRYFSIVAIKEPVDQSMFGKWAEAEPQTLQANEQQFF